MFRLAVETGEDGEVTRIVFLALRGEEGRMECFWPISALADESVEAAVRKRRNDAPAMQLPHRAVTPVPRRGRPAARQTE
jgi:hypothetical protein